ncbi:MAG TPA: hypothetical protein VJN70_00175 [Gemmatimonadaceae bacterium]|nr:hypothetical protein [Gemmatimonadaceae bacterium]
MLRILDVCSKIPQCGGAADAEWLTWVPTLTDSEAAWSSLRSSARQAGVR